MKKQWKQFLQNNEAAWSYNIVPGLVRKLAQAATDKEKEDLLEDLALQGVTISGHGDLEFLGVKT